MSNRGLSNQQANELFVKAERLEERRDFRMAFRCLLKAAEQGHGSGQLNLANFYASGVGVKRDLERAAYWYKAAYKRGNVAAARNLAIDRAAAGNIRSAVFWFGKGIEQGDGGSFVALAKIYAKRRGSRRKAIELLKRMSKLSRIDASDLDREQAECLLTQLQKL